MSMPQSRLNCRLSSDSDASDVCNEDSGTVPVSSAAMVGLKEKHC